MGLLVSLYLYWDDGQWIALAIFLGVNLLILLFSSILTVQADRLAGTLNISRRGLLRHYQRKVNFYEIESIQLGRSYSSGKSSSNSYRIEVRLSNGDIIPLRNVYTSGRKKKAETIEALREFIGVSGAPTSMGGMADFVAQAIQSDMQVEQDTVRDSQIEVHETDGVRWQVEFPKSNNTPIIRWFAPDYALPGQVFYLAQKLAGQPGNKLMRMVMKSVFSPSLLPRIYGFDDDDAPGIKDAEMMELNGRLNDHFAAYASDEQIALPILNRWEMTSLISWAEKYPLKQGSSSQLVVLLGSNGLYLAMAGHANTKQVEELSNLGVELARWQG